MVEQISSSSLWTQVRAAYPTASLISELLQIHEQQYVVRVQIECGNLVLATGLSADRHIEKAEDQARERAIALLQLPSPQPSPAPVSVQPTPVELPVELTPAQPTPPPQPSPPKPAPPKPQAKAPEPEPEKRSSMPPIEDTPEDYADEPLIPPPAPKAEPLPEPEEEFDFSDISLKIDTELGLIGWNSKRESDYLKRIYGKNKRLVLSDQEMKEFLEYLQAYAQTSVEMKNLGWSDQKGKDYLKSKYPESQGSRLMLNCSQIKEFLHDLQHPEASGEEFF